MPRSGEDLRNETPAAVSESPADVPRHDEITAMRWLRLGLDAPLRPLTIDTAIVATIALAAGIMLGRSNESMAVDQLLTAATLLLGAAVAGYIFRWRTVCMLAMLCVVVLLGAIRAIEQQHALAADDLSAKLGSQAMIVKLQGVVRTDPDHRVRTGGSMARFDYRPPSTYFQMRVEAVIRDDGRASPVQGNVLVRVDETMPPFRAGDAVVVTGRISPFRAPVNPGEFDYSRHARALQQAGMVIVPDRRLVELTPHRRWEPFERFLVWRERVQRRASGWLLSDLPRDTAEGDRAALLAALLLGEREKQYEQIDETFRRVGLAHLLAISGLHLGILVGLVLMLARLGSGMRATHGWLIIATILVYLIIVEVRLPLTRAAIMTMAGALGLALGRPMYIGGLIAVSAAGILIWRPDQLYSPGFQLSFGVVLALAHLAPVAHARWFGRRNPESEPQTIGEIIAERVKMTVTAAVVAWFVATPIVMHHFGIISPLAIVLSVVLMPVIALLLTLGFCKLLASPVLPSLALIVGVPLATMADMTLSLVRAADDIPISSMNVHVPHSAWALAALTFAVMWLRYGFRRQRAVQVLSTVVVAWYLMPVSLGSSAAMRIDMLSVGDGSCIIVRTGESCVVFDAGSSTNLNAGDASILPAMRALGVVNVDAIVISHANLDHYSAALEIAERYRVPSVFVTPQMLDHVDATPLGPLTYLLDEVTKRRLALRTVAAGDSVMFRDMRWTWLHPPAGSTFAKTNDASMMIRVEVDTSAGTRSLLLTGDVQIEAIALAMQAHPELRADVMELPHHGSFNEAAVALVMAVQPQIVLQSTGWRRLERDPWLAALDMPGIMRLVTARDGACWVEIDHEGNITAGSFNDQKRIVPTAPMNNAGS